MLKAIAIGGALTGALGALPCAGQEFPQRMVQMVVPYPAGGVADAQARIIAQRLSERWGEPVVVENKSGGLTIPGTAAVAKAARDCHMLLLSGLPVPLNAISGRSLPYDTATQLAPISHITDVPNLLVVPTSSPFRSLAELVDYAGRNPRKLTYGSTGIGGTSHLASELLAAAAGSRALPRRRDRRHRPGGRPSRHDVRQQQRRERGRRPSACAGGHVGGARQAVAGRPDRCRAGISGVFRIGVVCDLDHGRIAAGVHREAGRRHQFRTEGRNGSEPLCGLGCIRGRDITRRNGAIPRSRVQALGRSHPAARVEAGMMPARHPDRLTCAPRD
jgi:hypothetical protein